MDKKERMLNLYKNGKVLKEFIEVQLPTLRNPKIRIIHKDGFVIGSSCDTFLNMNVSYMSESSKFTDSTTLLSDIHNINFPLVKEYFIKYLNNHKDEIMTEVANLMIEEAISLKSEVLSEIEQEKKNIQESIQRINYEN